MVDTNLTSFNYSSEMDNKKFFWTPTMQNTIFSAFAWSGTAGVLPLTWAIQKYGVRIVIFIIGVLSAIATLLSPFLAMSFGFYAFLVCRLFQGLGYSVIMSAVAAIVAYWSPLAEMGIFTGILTATMQLSPVLTMPLSGALCTSGYGWPSVYYVHGVLTIIVTGIWGLVYRNGPSEHSWISPPELEKITNGKGAAKEKTEAATTIPWKAMFSSMSVWAILVATFGNMFGIQLLIYYTPTFLKHILNFDLLSSGALAALPYLTQFGVKIVAGLLSDHTPCLPESIRLKIFNTVSLAGMAVFLAALGFTPKNASDIGVALLVCAAAILGFNAGGFYKSATLVGRQFSPTVMGFVQLISCFILLVVPFIKGAIVQNEHEITEWRVVFLLAAGILFLCNVVFCICGSAQPAPWTMPINGQNCYMTEEKASKQKNEFVEVMSTI